MRGWRWRGGGSHGVVRSGAFVIGASGVISGEAARRDGRAGWDGLADAAPNGSERESLILEWPLSFCFLVSAGERGRMNLRV
jgi:hypothetical protein